MNNVIKFPSNPSEFTGLDDEQIDRHPLRAYMQGFTAATKLALEQRGKSDEQMAMFFSGRIGETFMAGAKAAWEVVPSQKPAGPRGRKPGSTARYSLRELADVYIWVERRIKLQGETKTAACEWLAKRGTFDSSRTALRRYNSFVALMNDDAARKGEFTKAIEAVRYYLTLEDWKRKGLTAEQLNITNPADIAEWKKWTSPLPKDPPRRSFSRSK